jgi:phosphoribosylamine--glycine ligase
MASDGYPAKYETGFPMTIPEKLPHDAEVFVAGAKLEDGKLLTAGGRVLGVTAVADDLKTAIDYAYDAVKEVKFENARCRSDIGQRALKALK